MPLASDIAIELWQMWKGSRRLTASVAWTDQGLRLQQSLDGASPFFERTFDTLDALIEWDNDDRKQCHKEGWRTRSGSAV